MCLKNKNKLYLLIELQTMVDRAVFLAEPKEDPVESLSSRRAIAAAPTAPIHCSGKQGRAGSHLLT